MAKSERAAFIERHGLWSDEQRRLAADVMRRVEAQKLRFVRLAWGDTHGYSRAKTLTIPAFVSALTNGYNIGVATTTLDSAGARVFASFTRGGGMGLAEMTGSPNLTIVADPATFRVLPWADGVGWILGDEYFNDGRPFHFSPRQILRKTLRPLAERGCKIVIGPEIEWYLLRVVEAHLSEDNVGAPGLRGRPIKTAPVEPGYHYHSESNMDLMHEVFDALGSAFETLGLGLALDRKRMGSWTGRMHLRATQRARSRRQRALVPHRHSTNLQAARLFCHLHVSAGAQGLLFQRLASAPNADRRREW
jgi:glutamine synthetase